MKIITIVTLFAFVLFSFAFPDLILAESSSGVVNISAHVAGCGDAIIQTGEECDGPNLNGQTCGSQGFSTGSLSCTASCFLNTSACTNVASSPSVGSISGGTIRDFFKDFLPPFFKPEPGFIPSKADINNDGVVDLVDLSILLYYYNKTADVQTRYDFNEDGKVDLIDISILLYYWTG